jgi:FAD/FMN-containing dehydrogenase
MLLQWRADHLHHDDRPEIAHAGAKEPLHGGRHRSRVHDGRGTLYLATTRYVYTIRSLTVMIYPQTMSTDIHKFALVAGDVAYRGSGVVTGHLGWDYDRKSYRLSEHNGDLRVLTYTGSDRLVHAGGCRPARPHRPPP